MLRYPVRLEPTDDGVRLIVPDVPEVALDAPTETKAFEGAVEALEAALGAYVLAARPIPRPSDICGAPVIETARFSLSGYKAGQRPR
jgi:antitoxin HicB